MLQPIIGNTGASTIQVTGNVVVSSIDSPGVLGYYGVASGVMPNLNMCVGDPNACGVHVHSGFSCDNATVQGGHFFDQTFIPNDPWANEQLESDANGNATFGGILDIGTFDLEGRAFIGELVSRLLALYF